MIGYPSLSIFSSQLIKVTDVGQRKKKKDPRVCDLRECVASQTEGKKWSNKNNSCSWGGKYSGLYFIHCLLTLTLFSMKEPSVILWLREPGWGPLISKRGATDRCALQPAQTLPLLLANKTVSFMEHTPTLQGYCRQIYSGLESSLCNNQNLFVSFSFFLILTPL